MNAPLNSQAVQAATFVFENADFVSRVHELLQLASEALVEKLCRRALSGAELDAVIAAVEARDHATMFNLVRPQATQMRAADVRDVYWDWIDAYGFYSDALSCNWPYMTQDKRCCYLAHAEVSALIVCTK